MVINNLKGYIVKDGSILYLEKLKDNLFFAIIEMYEKNYERFEHKGSSDLFIKTGIVKSDNPHKWTNGVMSLLDAEEQESVKSNEEFRQLSENIITKDGCIVKEVSLFEGIGEGIKYRTLKWWIEVPKNIIVNKLNNK